jgi:hypothetical protein
MGMFHAHHRGYLKSVYFAGLGKISRSSSGVSVAIFLPGATDFMLPAWRSANVSGKLLSAFCKKFYVC